jgi:acyl-CoA synthetase (NDP forming)
MKMLIEKEAENFLEKEGFNVVKRRVVSKKEDLEKAISSIGTPIAMKISSKKIIHKARVKGVVVNIHGLKAAEKAFDKLKKINGFEEVLVKKMIMGQFIII